MDRFVDRIIDILILAIVQGLTEWLPISSSGHLVIVQEYLGLRLPLVFDVALHVGTLFVILIVFWNSILKLLKALFRFEFQTEEGRMALLIAIGSLPTAIIGYLFHDFFEYLFYDLFVVGFALIITGFFLFASRFRKGCKELGFLDSLLIGVAQGLAIVPGISRSGTTIATGLLRGVKRENAFTYSFLLSIPAIVGAAISESRDLVMVNVSIFTLVIGVVTATIVGYIALELLLRIIMRGKLHLFAYYCWIAGFLIILS